MADSPRIEELKRRVRSDPASIAFAALAEEYRRAQRFEEAIETCTAGLIRHPSYLSAHVTLGRALIEVGRLEDARNELGYVLKLAPENLAAIRGLAEIHDRLGDEGSHELQQPAESQTPEPSAPQMTVAEIHAASGFTQPAAEEAEPGLSYAPPAWEAEPVTPPVPAAWEAEPFAPAVPPTFEAEPPPSHIPISVEETAAPEPPPVLQSVSYIQQAAAEEPALAPFDPSTSSGSSRAKSRDDSAQGSPELSRGTGLEEFLKAILRARASRAGSL